MKLNFVLAILFAAASIRPEAFARAASADGDDEAEAGEGDDEYDDLPGMTDEELEEICTSRGFKLVREIDADAGGPAAYAHRDYVDAAGECLRIEADLKEILRSQTEILEDVKRESKRMMNERDGLLVQLNQQQGIDGPTNRQGNNTVDDEESGHVDGEVLWDRNDAILAETYTNEDRSNNKLADADANEDQSDNKLTYDTKEVTAEVIEQMKSDAVNFILPEELPERTRAQVKRRLRPALTKVVNFILPEKLRGKMLAQVKQRLPPALTNVVNFILPEKLREKMLAQVKQRLPPALTSFISVANAMGTTAYDTTRRYLKMFYHGTLCRYLRTFATNKCYYKEVYHTIRKLLPKINTILSNMM